MADEAKEFKGPGAVECKGCKVPGECRKCKGKGYLPDENGEYLFDNESYRECPFCNATGICPGCGGSGWIVIRPKR